jgi:hypothetical protein
MMSYLKYLTKLLLMQKPSKDSDSFLRFKQQSKNRVWLKRESLPRDNRSHAPIEVRSKCLDLSRIYIAGYATFAVCVIAVLNHA